MMPGSGPEGAGVVLREPTVDHAVLEVARGGILRRGLGFDECDVGILLNAEDPTVVGLEGRAGGRVIYFSIDPENETVRQHFAAGGTAVVLEQGQIVLRSHGPAINVLPVLNAPITLQGLVTFNIANVLAAVAALHGLGTPVHVIRNGISTFHPSASQNPGRMNLIDFGAFKVIVDYGHNVPAVTALASVYDHVIVADVDPRTRAPGETPELVRTGALGAGLPDASVEVVRAPLEAIDRGFEILRAGDLMVVQVDEVAPMLGRVMEHFERRLAGA